MLRLRHTAAAIALLGLAGCGVQANLDAAKLEATIAAVPATATSPAIPAHTDPVVALRAFSINDLNVAQADAVAHQDQAAMTCYPALISTIRNLPSVAAIKIEGAFSAFQAARDVANGVKSAQGGLPQAINIACAPLILDAQQTILQLAVKVGAGAGIPGLGLLP